MNAESSLLQKIRDLVAERKYRIRLHAVRHMIEEGFDEDDVIEALAGRCKLVEDYPGEMRCLVLGYFDVGSPSRQALHVVCDYSADHVVDIVTAYLPQKPWWVNPGKRGRLT
jgi:Domain of unknown function (DUF4258)